MSLLAFGKIYSCSDCYGGGSTSPFERPDADALIETDFESFPHEYIRREFDILHTPGITDHLLRQILHLHKSIRGMVSSTGVLINGAPRTKKGESGHDFYRAELANGGVVVVSPLDALSAVGKEVDQLHRIKPSEFPPKDQYRSGKIGKYLPYDIKEYLEEVDPKQIPAYPDDWRVSYVDRFGNVITHAKNPDGIADSLRKSTRQRILLTLGENLVGGVEITTSLDDATPGLVSIYRNGDNFDVVRKRAEGETAEQSLAASAYNQFNQPRIGDIASFTGDPTSAIQWIKQ